MDWLYFAFGVIVCTVFIYLPGYFALRALRFSRFLSVVSAPVITLAEYGIFSVVLGAMGVSNSWWLLFLTFSVVGAVCMMLSIRFRGSKPRIVIPKEKQNHVWRHMILYLGVAIVLVGVFFVRTLDGVDSFIPGNDATTHLNTIQLFLDTGNWSSLSGAYYPEGWAGLATMVAQALSVNAPFAANILNTTILYAVYPLSLLGFFVCCFKDCPRVITCGSVCTLALVGFPWNFLPLNMLGPALLGFSLVPIGILIFMLLLQKGDRFVKVTLGLTLVLYVVSNVFSHPSALFAMGVFVVPYVVYRLATYNNERMFPHGKQGVVRRVVCIAGFLVLVAIIWGICFKSPLLSSTVSFVWPAWTSVGSGFKTALTLSFADNPAQWMAAILLLMGVMYTLYKKRYLWITVGFLFFFVAFVMDISTDGPLKQVLTGFWYTSIRRLAAAACIMGVPLLSLGCYVAVQMLRNVLKIVFGMRFNDITIQRLALGLFLPCFTVVNFIPSFSVLGPTGQVNTTFGYLSETLASQNSVEGNWVLDKEERNFLKKVKDITGDDVVFNLPCDGSAYAYCLDLINVADTNYFLNSDSDSAILRDSINEISNNIQVQQAAENLGVRYVLLLDYGQTEDATIYPNMFDETKWKGILAITDETPGFELVLSEGDMRLYRIDI